MPKVSVIIPTYNVAPYIRETIDSVLFQTYKDYEIIIIDSSTDNTKNIILEYIDKYPDKIKYFYQPRSGVAAARNKGIAESNSDYIAILEDDTWILPEKLELQVKILEENLDTAMVYSDAEAFDGKNVIRMSVARPISPQQQGTFRWKILQAKFNDGSILKQNIFKDLLLGNLIIAPSVVIRRKYLDCIGFFDVNLLTEDFDFWVRLSEKFPIIYLNKVTTRYRLRDDSISGPRQMRGTIYKESDAKVYAQLMKRYPNLVNFLKKRICAMYKDASWGYLNNFCLKKCRQTAMSSLFYNKFQFKLYLYVAISFLPLKIVKIIKTLKNKLCQKLV
jgi:glycosyltransferase involved in cell wall biosynthesis